MAVLQPAVGDHRGTARRRDRRRSGRRRRPAGRRNRWRWRAARGSEQVHAVVGGDRGAVGQGFHDAHVAVDDGDHEMAIAHGDVDAGNDQQHEAGDQHQPEQNHRADPAQQFVALAKQHAHRDGLAGHQIEPDAGESQREEDREHLGQDHVERAPVLLVMLKLPLWAADDATANGCRCRARDRAARGSSRAAMEIREVDQPHQQDDAEMALWLDRSRVSTQAPISMGSLPGTISASATPVEGAAAVQALWGAA